MRFCRSLPGAQAMAQSRPAREGAQDPRTGRERQDPEGGEQAAPRLCPRVSATTFLN